MPSGVRTGRTNAAFSLLELTIVLGVVLIIAALSLPRISVVLGNMKLRASMTTVSGFLQNARMLAIKKNATMTARHFNRTAVPYSLVFYVKDATDTSGITTNDPQVEMEAPIASYDTPSGTGAPPAISNAALGLSTNPRTGDPSFNARGLPCASVGGTCVNDAFIKYFKDNRAGTSGGWSAISITPAGRIRRWFWNGSSWTD